jgi:hypothetical protein
MLAVRWLNNFRFRKGASAITVTNVARVLIKLKAILVVINAFLFPFSTSRILAEDGNLVQDSNTLSFRKVTLFEVLQMGGHDDVDGRKAT